ncbi:MAG: helix-turn-helix domain-containing protein [Candidatus Limnocylindria bacterium]
MKSPRARMDILAAFRELGSYRAAADLCGTTHKTVRRILERQQQGPPPPRRAPPTQHRRRDLRRS